MAFRFIVPALAAGLLLCPAAAEAETTARQMAARDAASRQASTREAASAIQMINAYRASSWMGPLRLDPKLTAAAAEQSRAMAAAGTMSHDVGGAFQARMRRHGIGDSAENIGYGYASVGEAVAGWRGSYAHNANMLNRLMTRAGFARAVGAGGRPFWTLILAR
ncbi:MAG: CAP domain-containing protein [Rhizobiales bacterium]|nr:CAP domain-containing protein [Hyphomicrobiales bacterium]